MHGGLQSLEEREVGKIIFLDISINIAVFGCRYEVGRIAVFGCRYEVGRAAIVVLLQLKKGGVAKAKGDEGAKP